MSAWDLAAVPVVAQGRDQADLGRPGMSDDGLGAFGTSRGLTVVAVSQ